MKKALNRASVVIQVVGVVLAISGCGKAEDAANPPVNTASPVTEAPPAPAPGTCPAGQFPGLYGCAPASNLSQACLNTGGWMISQDLCRVQFSPLTWSYFYSFSNYSMSLFPRLTPSMVPLQDMSAMGVRVYSGDVVKVRGNGGWGSRESSVKRLFGFIPVVTTTYDCNQVDLDGKSGSGEDPVMNEGMAAGLAGTDGTEVFLLGSNSTKQITHNGLFRVGFNTPSFELGCYQVNLYELSITRCFNSSGNVVACP